MKYLIFILIIGIGFTSSKKTDNSYNEKTHYTPNTSGDEDTKEIDWHTQYSNRGVLPYHVYNNELVGTKWVLWEYYDGFAHPNLHDSIEFVDNKRYRVFATNTTSWSAVRRYTLSSLPNNTNKELTLYYFSPFGGSC